VWLFDLDNTLHDATPHIFPHINRAMATYIRHHLGVDDDEATRLRLDYWQRYGATLLGLMRHHGTDPQHFLRHTHDFPDLKQMLVFERGLNAMLRRLPGARSSSRTRRWPTAKRFSNWSGCATGSQRCTRSSGSASSRSRHSALSAICCAASDCRHSAASWSRIRSPT
jgi:hypothetical protein